MPSIDIQVTTLQKVVISFESSSRANHFYQAHIKDQVRWNSTVIPSTCYKGHYDSRRTITLIYDKTRQNFQVELADLTDTNVSKAFSAIVDWAMPKELEINSVDEEAIWSAQKSRAQRAESNPEGQLDTVNQSERAALIYTQLLVNGSRTSCSDRKRRNEYLGS